MCNRRRCASLRQSRASALSLRLRFLGAPRAHFHQQKAHARRQLVEFLERQPFAAHEVDQQMIEAFEPDGLVFQRQRNGIGGQKRIVKSQARSARETAGSR